MPNSCFEPKHTPACAIRPDGEYLHADQPLQNLRHRLWRPNGGDVKLYQVARSGCPDAQFIRPE